MSEFVWWKGKPVAASAVLTLEGLKQAHERVKNTVNDNEFVGPTLYLPPAIAHAYCCMLAKAYWKREYREWRVFRRMCEMGWMNVRHADI